MTDKGIMRILTSTLTLLININITVDCYRILGLFPNNGKSHVDVFLPIMEELSRRGHEVTVISYFPQEISLPRYRDISLKGSAVIRVNVKHIGAGLPWYYQYLSPIRLGNMGRATCESGLKLKAIQEFISSNEQFDVILSEIFVNECFLGVARKIGAPIVSLSSQAIMPWAYDRFGQPDNPAYIPSLFTEYSDRMTFLQRVMNTLVQLFHKMLYKYLIYPADQAMVEKYSGLTPEEFNSVIMSSNLFLVNTHYTLNLPKPNVPGVVEVAGIHIRERKPAQPNIEKWINESTDGVVYFSLGSVIKGHTFPEDKKQAFLRAFSRLPQRVLWKWENDTMPGKPDNVMIQKWMQQFDILCHPNVKAFISHGGLLGTIEAVHCGVPVIVMPQFGDQFTNARALETNGGGVILHLNEATEEKVYKALKTVLRPEFKKQAEELSRRFRDRPMSPMDTAIYWIEYVARHKGAHFMRTAAVGMPWYQYLLLDVVAFLILVLATIIAINFYLMRAVIRYIRNRSKRKQEHKENNAKKNN